MTEPVHVVDHDPAWGARAAGYAEEIRELFGGWLVSEVVHVGSTAIPGLPAKPIVDLQAVAADPAAALDAVGPSLTRARWMFVPREMDQRAWRWLFVRIDPVDEEGSTRLAHLHLIPPGQARWREQLLFRDRLRASAPLRAEYAALKQRAAADHRHDREAYGRAKSEFVLRVLTAG